jgi:hypothetical protein
MHAAAPAAPAVADLALPRLVVRLTGVLATLLGRTEGAELSEDEVLDGLRVAGHLTYPSPLLGALINKLPEVFAAEVLPHLDPADLAFVAQVDSGCRATVVASGLPCAGMRVGMRELFPVDRALLAQAVRAAPPGVNVPDVQLAALGYVESMEAPRVDGVVRLELEVFCSSAGRLAWAKASGCRWDEWTPVFCAQAAGVGSLEALKWARDHGCPWDVWTCMAAAANDRPDLLQWARQHDCPWDKATCEQAAAGGHLEVLQWARQNGCPWDEETCEMAAQYGRLKSLQWAWQNGCPWSQETCEVAAQYGHLEVLQWARQHDCPWGEYTCGIAAEYGRLEVLQWARENGCPWDAMTCNGAAVGGHLEVLRWAREHHCPWDSETCANAAAGGHLEVLKWAREHECPWDSSTLEMLRWLDGNGAP